MAYSHLPFPSTQANQLKIIANDTVIWLSPTGNDATGDGTESLPYLTLAKAMSAAREYTITGTAILYIRFKRGEYAMPATGNVSLYHPQGANIIIEGDPAEFKQRVIYQVEGYSWNLERWSGGGHTGTLRLWDGATLATGHTLHGFSANETGMYFSVTNASISSRSGYRSYNSNSKGVRTTNADGKHTYMTVFNGDRFFNHGYSYEDAQGILGIGRIHSATGSSDTLPVQFNNLNYDCRCPGWTWGAGSGGLNNTLSWAGIPSNYPEPQYSQPNGYYGSPNWSSDVANDNTAYPSNPGVSQNTDDPYILSTYPVVLRFQSQSSSLTLKDGTIRGIRNLLFASHLRPILSADGWTPATPGLGITANITQSMQASIVNRGGYIRGTGLHLENAKISIRHLGFFGIATPIVAKSSEIRTFYESSVEPAGAANPYTEYTPTVYGTDATVNSSLLDNSPILNITQADVGISAYNSTLDFVDASGYGREYTTNYRMEGIYISALRLGIRMFNSSLLATSVFINGIQDTPTCSASIIVPIFPGSTVADGVSADFNAYGGVSIATKYPVMKVFMELSDGFGPRELGYVTNWVYSANLGSSDSVIKGLTDGASLVGPDALVNYRYWYPSILKTVPHGLSFWNGADIQCGITSGAGGTLSIKLYKDMALSGVSAQYIIGKNTILVTGANGVTRGWSGMGTGNAIGSSAASCFPVFGSYGGHFAEDQGAYSTGALWAIENSSVNILKSLWINNGGHNAVDIRKNSRLNVGDTSAIYAGAHDPGQSVMLTIPNDTRYNNGALAITGYAQTAVRITENSSATIGTLFTKHPMHSDGIASANASNDTGTSSSPRQACIEVSENSSAKLTSAHCVGHIGGSTIRSGGDGLFTTITGLKIGNRVASTDIANRDTFIRVDRGSQFILRADRQYAAAYGQGSVFSMDGGTGAGISFGYSSSSPEITVFNVGSGSHAVVERVNASANTATQPITDIMVLSDNRSAGTPRKIMTRSTPGSNGTIYGFSGLPETRIWSGFLDSGVGYSRHGTNIGTEGSGGSLFSSATDSSNLGCTLHAHVDSVRGGSISTR